MLDKLRKLDDAQQKTHEQGSRHKQQPLIERRHAAHHCGQRRADFINRSRELGKGHNMGVTYLAGNGLDQFNAIVKDKFTVASTWIPR